MSLSKVFTPPRSSAPTSPVLTRLPQPLDPLQWVALQTGLSNAQRVALHVLVIAYAYFQRENGQFFIAESVVSRYLSTTFPTFRNYVTTLHNLGLLTLKFRSLNQHSEKSLWAMNLDVVLHNGQLPLTLTDISNPDEEEPADAPEPASEPADEPAQEPADELDEYVDQQPEVTATQTESELEDLDISALSDAEVAAIVDAKRNDPEWQSLLSMTAEELAVKMDDIKELGNRLDVVTRYTDSQKQARVEPKASRKTLPGKPPVTMKSDLLIDFDKVVKTFGVSRLSEAETAQILDMEARWMQKNPGERTPTEFVQYAADEAARSSRRDSVKYMLKVLEDSLERGFTSRRFPQSGSGQWGSRYGMRKNRY